MATDIEVYHPFDAGAGKNAQESAWRQMARLWNGSGVDFSYASKFNTFGDSSGRQVRVDTGRAWVDGFYGESTVQKVISLATNSSGSTRIDRIVLAVDPTGNKVQIDVVQGTPGAGIPALTQNATGTYQMTLAYVTMLNNYTTVAAGDVTDERTSIEPLLNPSVRVNHSAVTNVNSATSTVILFDSERYDSEAIHSTSANTGRLTCVTPGIYNIFGNVVWTANTTGFRQLTFKLNGTTDIANDRRMTVTTASETVSNILTTQYRLKVGDYVEAYLYQNSGTSPLPVTVNGNYSPEFGMTWVAP